MIYCSKRQIITNLYAHIYGLCCVLQSALPIDIVTLCAWKTFTLGQKKRGQDLRFRATKSSMRASIVAYDDNLLLCVLYIDGVYTRQDTNIMKDKLWT